MAATTRSVKPCGVVHDVVVGKNVALDRKIDFSAGHPALDGESRSSVSGSGKAGASVGHVEDSELAAFDLGVLLGDPEDFVRVRSFLEFSEDETLILSCRVDTGLTCGDADTWNHLSLDIR
jgi:hypothetical protein